MREGPEVAEPFWLGERSTLGKAAEADDPSEPMLTMLPERCLPRELADDTACHERACMQYSLCISQDCMHGASGSQVTAGHVGVACASNALQVAGSLKMHSSELVSTCWHEVSGLQCHGLAYATWPCRSCRAVSTLHAAATAHRLGFIAAGGVNDSVLRMSDRLMLVVPCPGARARCPTWWRWLA